MSEVAHAEGCAGANMDWDARRSDADRIRSLEVGDFFHAAGITRGGLVGLVVEVTATTITARHVPFSSLCTFDRITGKRFPDEHYTPDDDGSCVIDSVEPLPLSVHLRLIDMDRRGRLRPMENRLPPQSRNWRAMNFAQDHYAAHAFDSAAAGDDQ